MTLDDRRSMHHHSADPLSPSLLPRVLTGHAHSEEGEGLAFEAFIMFQLIIEEWIQLS
jgi:hypothetical protein